MSNGGHGGCHRYDPIERGDRGRQDLAELDAWAVLWNAGSDLAGYEDTDQLVNRLVVVARLNRMRRLVFVIDDEDYWSGGRAHAVVGIADRAAAIEHVRRQYPGRNARRWDQNRGEWVPVD